MLKGGEAKLVDIMRVEKKKTKKMLLYCGECMNVRIMWVVTASEIEIE